MFNRDDVMELVDCRRCKHYKSFSACWEEPEASMCDNGDFGAYEVCDEILGAVDRLLEDGYLESKDGYLAERDEIFDDDLQEYRTRSGMDVDLYEHKYWYISWEGNPPVGYDSLKEIWEELFL